MLMGFEKIQNITTYVTLPKPTPSLIYIEVLLLKNFKACFPRPPLPRGDFWAFFASIT